MAEMESFIRSQHNSTCHTPPGKDNIGKTCEDTFQYYIPLAREVTLATSSPISIRGASDHNRSRL